MSNTDEPVSDLLDEKYVEALSEEQFAQIFESLRGKIQEDPYKYFIESELFCNFKPVAGQVVALKQIFDQPLDPDNVQRIAQQVGTRDNGVPIMEWTMMDEWEIYEYMAKKPYHLDNVGKDKKNNITICLGRRGGKTTLAGKLGIWSAIRLDWRGLRDKKGELKKREDGSFEFFGLGDKEFGEVKILSRSVGYSEDILTEVKATFDRSPILRRLIDPNGEQSKGRISLKIPSLRDGKLNYCNIKITVDAATANTARGGAVIFAILDECAFLHQDPKYVDSLGKVLAALQPALKQFGDEGILVLASTPASKIGPFYERVSDPTRFGKKHLMLQGESWIFNNILTLEQWEDAYREDPYEFPTEYQAKFVDSRSQFFRAECVNACIDPGVTRVKPRFGNDIAYIGAIDAAYKGDRFAFSIVAVEREGDSTIIRQMVSKAWGRKNRNDTVDLKEVGGYIDKAVKEYQLDQVWADQYGYIPLRELFKDRHNITLVEFPFTNQSKKLIYKNLQTLVDHGSVKLLDDKILVNELITLELEVTEGGQIKIMHAPGKHDDLADALALASYKGIEKGEMLFNLSSETTFGVKTYGVKYCKVTGKAINGAPSPDKLRTLSHKYEEFSEVNDNSDVYEYEDNKIIKPLFSDPYGFPIYDKDLRTEYPGIYRAYLDGIVKTQADFEQAILNPAFDDDHTAGFSFR